MSNGEVVVRDEMSPLADDYLIQVADQAEKRIDAVIKIKQVALKVTNARDWTDQQGNPYLQVSGSEKIANLFNISWRIEEPKYEEEPDGHFTYSIKGEFSLGGRTIEVEGTRSSKDPFFNRYEYIKDANGKEVKTVKPPQTIDKGDVKKAALTNLYGNGITRMLGIRNLTWDDLQKFAGITKEMVLSKVSYNQRESNQPEIKPPQSKSAGKTDAPPVEGESITAVITKVDRPAAEKKPWSIIADGKKFTFFSDTIGEMAEGLLNKSAVISYVKKGNFFNCTGLAPAQDAPTAAAEIVAPADCPKNPMNCDHSNFNDKNEALCVAMGGAPCNA